MNIVEGMAARERLIFNQRRFRIRSASMRAIYRQPPPPGATASAMGDEARLREASPAESAQTHFVALRAKLMDW
jgi:hypothetical protein